MKIAQNSLLKRKWGSLEHRVWAKFKEESITDINFFVLAVSGGLDSIVLLDLLTQLRPRAHFLVLHYHHGESEQETQKKYRDDCLNLVKRTCDQLIENGFDVQFKFSKAKDVLRSENDFRQARLKFFKQELKQYKINFPNDKIYFTTGHHQDDLLETRLLKMIRGSGAESLKQFCFVNKTILRPLLFENKTRILQHAQHNNLKWMDDPSNQSSQYLRNWIRNKWLKSLETKRPGSVAKLAQSLDVLIAAVDLNDDIIEINDGFNLEHNESKRVNKFKLQCYWLSRQNYVILSREMQIKALARLLSKLKVQFSAGQLKEIQKRLDKNQKELTFMVARVNWVINAQQIMVQLEV